MKKPYNGMRKGISLVEMTIAVILFAVLSTIAMLYYKSLFNIDLTAKKARIASLMDQGYQLSGAYDVYVAQTGVAPSQVNLSDFNASNILILKSLPRNIREMTTTGWELNISAAAGRPAFQFAIDLNGTGWSSLSDDDFYCAIFNHEINSSVELNVTNGMNYGDAATLYSTYGSEFCYTDTAGMHHIMIVK